MPTISLCPDYGIEKTNEVPKRAQGDFRSIVQGLIETDFKIFMSQVELFSRRDENFLGLPHAISLALGKPMEELGDIVCEIIQNGYLLLALDYKAPSENTLDNIKNNAKFMTGLLFVIADLKDIGEIIEHFSSEFTFRFPCLKVKYIQEYSRPKFLKEQCGKTMPTLQGQVVMEGYAF